MSYQVKHGDSPASIARRHGVSVGALLGANPHKPTVMGVGVGGPVQTWTSLGVGEYLNIPRSTGVGDWGVGAIAPAPLMAAHKQISITNPGPHVADADVALWQTIIGTTPDGLFGPNTQAATKTWQAAHGLSADGIVGPLTWAAAMGSAAVAPAATAPSIQIPGLPAIQLPTFTAPAPAPAPAPVPAVVPAAIPTVTPVAAPAAAAALAIVDPCYSGNVDMVCAAQKVLGVSVDGKYGNDTANALRKFIPSAPAGCSPRPSWWTPTGQSNCGGLSLPSLPIPTPAASIPTAQLPIPATPVTPATSIPVPSIPSVIPAASIPTQPGPIQPTVTAPTKAGMNTGVLVVGGLGVAALVAVVAMSGKKGGGGHGGGSHAPHRVHKTGRKRASRKRR